MRLAYYIALSVLALAWAGGLSAQSAAASPSDHTQRSVRAALPVQVTLQQDSCPDTPYDARELSALLEVELSALGVASFAERTGALDQANASAASGRLALLRIGCSATADVLVLQIADMASGKELRREMVVADVEAQARPRALSIALAELLESSWMEPLAARSSDQHFATLPASVVSALRRRLRSVLATTSADSVVKTPPSAAVAAPPAPREPGSSLQASALLRSFPARSTALIGASFGYAVDFAHRLRLETSLEALLGNQEINDSAGRLGTMQLYWLTGGLGLSWVSQSVPELEVGPIVRFGYGAAHGVSTRPLEKVVSSGDVVTLVGVGSTLRAPLLATWDAVLGFDLGYLPTGVVFLSDLSRAAGMAEITLAARIGLASDF